MTQPGLSQDDREIQERTRRFVDDELIPWEVHAEEHEGRIPSEIHEAHVAKARELGLASMNMPRTSAAVGSPCSSRSSSRSRSAG